MRGSGVSQRFTRKRFDSAGGRIGRREHRRRGRLIGMGMTVIVILEVFENVAYVKEGIAIQADIHKRGLHAGEDAGDSALVDAANESELFFALDVNFD